MMRDLDQVLASYPSTISFNAVGFFLPLLGSHLYQVLVDHYLGQVPNIGLILLK